MADVCHAFWVHSTSNGFAMKLGPSVVFLLISAFFTPLAISSGKQPEVPAKEPSSASPASLINKSHCPSPADIVFNPVNKHWEAPLTEGMPASWGKMQSVAAYEAAESGDSFVFKQAGIDKEQGVYYLSCLYRVADFSREKSYEVVLEAENPMLMQGAIALPIITADGRWTGKATEHQHQFECQTYFEKCVFRIPQLVIQRQSTPNEPVYSEWDRPPERLMLGPLSWSTGEKSFIAEGKEGYVYSEEDFLSSTDRTQLLRGETQSMEDTYDIIKRLYDSSSGDVEPFEPCLDKKGFKLCGCTDADLKENIKKDSIALISVSEQFNNDGNLTGFSCKLIVMGANHSDALKDKP